MCIKTMFPIGCFVRYRNASDETLKVTRHLTNNKELFVNNHERLQVKFLTRVHQKSKYTEFTPTELINNMLQMQRFTTATERTDATTSLTNIYNNMVNS